MSYRSLSVIAVEAALAAQGVIRSESEIAAATEMSERHAQPGMEAAQSNFLVTVAQQTAWKAVYEAQVTALATEEAATVTYLGTLDTAISSALNAGDKHLAIALQREKAELA